MENVRKDRDTQDLSQQKKEESVSCQNQIFISESFSEKTY